jgi:hypothetical protein
VARDSILWRACHGAPLPTTAAATAVLAEVGRLYAWTAQALPEDLAFYDVAGQVLFASIAHEADSWFELARVSEAEIRAALPGLQFRRTEQPASRPAPNDR